MSPFQSVIVVNHQLEAADVKAEIALLLKQMVIW